MSGEFPSPERSSRWQRLGMVILECMANARGCTFTTGGFIVPAGVLPVWNFKQAVPLEGIGDAFTEDHPDWPDVAALEHAETGDEVINLVLG